MIKPKAVKPQTLLELNAQEEQQQDEKKQQPEKREPVKRKAHTNAEDMVAEAHKRMKDMIEKMGIPAEREAPAPKPQPQYDVWVPPDETATYKTPEELQAEANQKMAELMESKLKDKANRQADADLMMELLSEEAREKFGEGAAAAGGKGGGLPPGDWNCPSCGDHQFARNQQCRKCGAPNPKQGKKPHPYNPHPFNAMPMQRMHGPSSLPGMPMKGKGKGFSAEAAFAAGAAAAAKLAAKQEQEGAYLADAYLQNKQKFEVSGGILLME
jgi:hypothetical protein